MNLEASGIAIMTKMTGFSLHKEMVWIQFQTKIQDENIHKILFITWMEPWLFIDIVKCKQFLLIYGVRSRALFGWNLDFFDLKIF